MRILGIETSCDETGIAIYDSEQGIMGEALHSQVDVHKKYGGVVPELASRDHIRFAIPLLEHVFAQAQCDKTAIDGVAFTAGPGLVGALLVGASIGRSLAYAWQVPAIPVHHMEGHLLAPMLEGRRIDFSHLALLVSGGHTLLIKVNGLGDYELLGQSLDDAVGEAFDKTAKLLGLGYPGGPELAALAVAGEPGHFQLPRPLLKRKTLDFSFSGLKTAVLHAFKESDQSAQTKANLAAEFQQAIVDVLVAKCRFALQEFNLNSLVVAGGVGANQALREGLKTMTTDLNSQLFFPAPRYCTDNGAMIAYAGWRRLQAKCQQPALAVKVRARWPVAELSGQDCGV